MFEAIVTDVDGVLNTGRFLYDSSGKKYKEFGPHDADAIKLFRSLGVDVTAVTADKRGFPISSRRASDLGISIAFVADGQRYKWIKDNFSLDKIAFVGDGYSDIVCLRAAKYSFAPANSLSVVKDSAKYVLKASGGEGVLFEVLEYYISNFQDSTLLAKFKEGALNVCNDNK